MVYSLPYKSISLESVATLKPEKKYEDVKAQKSLIISENRGKAGIYRWTYKESGKSYIGRSVDLGARLEYYFNNGYLSRVGPKGIICSALKKYGHSQFYLDIMEYCDSSVVSSREQYYFDLLQPQYNIVRFSTIGELSKHRGKKVEVYDTLNKEVIICSSLREAGRHLGCVHSTLLKVLNKMKKELLNL